MKRCPYCHGTGTLTLPDPFSDQPCEDCGETGKMTEAQYERDRKRVLRGITKLGTKMGSR